VGESEVKLFLCMLCGRMFLGQKEPSCPYCGSNMVVPVKGEATEMKEVKVTIKNPSKREGDINS